MPTIYVNTDNSDRRKKLYIASKLGKSAAKAEEKMQDAVEAAVGKAPDFTTDKSRSKKGYTIILEVKVAAGAGKTTVSLNILINRYPDGDTVMTTVKSGTATVDGGPEGFPLDVLEDLVTGAVPKTFPVMRIDMMRR